ncbi:cation efflux family domain-containing protein [Ditylenchus destructor]|nr:cation efflux family domain-containing protein [Ditylenchus destructor]
MSSSDSNNSRTEPNEYTITSIVEPMSVENDPVGALSGSGPSAQRPSLNVDQAQRTSVPTVGTALTPPLEYASASSTPIAENAPHSNIWNPQTKISESPLVQIPKSPIPISEPASIAPPAAVYSSSAPTQGFGPMRSQIVVPPNTTLVSARPITTSAPGVNGSGSDPSLDAFHCHGENGSVNGSKSSNRNAVRVLWLSVVVCLFFMICEVVGGLWAQSLAIITDAAHLLTDLASMLISLFSLYIASRPASQRMSFGWHRAEVVGAFISVFLIWVVTGILVYLAIDRMITKEYEINPTIMAITAAIGVLVNLLMGVLLYFGGHSHSHGGAGHGHSHAKAQIETRRTSVSVTGAAIVSSSLIEEDNEATRLLSSASQPGSPHTHGTIERGEGGDRPAVVSTNINVRAAFIHVIGDLIQSVGVLIAALIILWNEEWSIVDPICTLLFSVIVVSTTVYVVRDALVVLLEGRPSNIDFRVVFDSLENIEGVRKVHDLRIWALTMDKVAISVHLEIAPDAQAQIILKNTTLMLREKFNVHESTVQIEGWQPESENCFQCTIPTR